jgi:hypothetical protein
VLERIRCLVDDEIDLTGHQILQRRAGAAIRDELEAGAGDVLKIDAGDMSRRTCARRSRRNFALVRFDPADELLEVLRRHAVLADHDHRVAGQQHDRLEIPQQVIRQRVDRPVDHMRAPVADAERIAVRGRACDPTDADRARRSGHVLDDDALAERSAHRLGQDARHRIDRSAGSERHHHRDRPRWIDLRRRNCAASPKDAAGGRDPQYPHDFPRWVGCAASTFIQP